jgi:hypothetical protein
MGTLICVFSARTADPTEFGPCCLVWFPPRSMASESLVVCPAPDHLRKETTRVGCYQSTLACKGEDLAIGREAQTLRRVEMWYSAIGAQADLSSLSHAQEWQTVCSAASAGSLPGSCKDVGAMDMVISADSREKRTRRKGVVPCEVQGWSRTNGLARTGVFTL